MHMHYAEDKGAQQYSFVSLSDLQAVLNGRETRTFGRLQSCSVIDLSYLDDRRILQRSELLSDSVTGRA